MIDFWKSIVRSVVPAIVAAVADFLAHWGLDIDANGLGGLETALFALFYAAYFIPIRLFEMYVHPKIGWLLGWPGAPKYSPVDQVVEQMQAPDPVNAK